MKSFRSIPLYMPAAFIISSIIFVIFPEIDLFFSHLFYDGKFYAGNSWWEIILYNSVKPILIILILGGIALWLYNRFKKQNYFNFYHKELLLIVITLALGSGLIVNALLKENWGRARPAQTTEFSGNLKFTPAFVISDQNGYSFSSGHASAAYVLISLALLARRRKTLWMSLAIGYGSLVGIARIAAGGHFLSDVVVSFFIMYFTAKITYNFLFDDIAT